MKHLPLISNNCVICGCPCKTENVGREPYIHTGSLVHKGGVITIGFGYGSKHDTEHYSGIICDECAKTLVETSASAWSTTQHPTFKNTEIVDDED